MHELGPRRSLIATAPTRLDFGGGWTDVPPFPEERGGFVCNLAIDRRASVVLRAPRDGEHDDATMRPESTLVAAALRRAARDARDPALHASLRVALSSDFPIGAGLGGSSAAGVALAAALAAVQRRVLTASQLAEWSRAVEVEELGIAGGRQDHYAAAFGGALALTFGADTIAERIPLDERTTRSLESRCLLVYTGESRISGETITTVLDAYRDRVPRVVDALDRMKALALQMRYALDVGDVDALAALVDEHWTHQRSLHPGISTARIDALSASARRAGATGVKALGASGGGCVIVFAPADGAPQIAKAVAPWGDVLDWRVSTDGVRVDWQEH